MLDYWTQLLEISSTQNRTQISEYRVLDTRQWNHYLHLILQETQLERPTAMSQEQMDIAWTQLEPELAVSVWGPAPVFKLTEGFVTQKFSSDNRRGRVLKMTTTRQTL